MTLHSWLMTQLDRDDPIGDIAREIAHDDQILDSTVPDLIRDYLIGLGVSNGCIEAFDTAVDEWLKHFPVERPI